MNVHKNARTLPVSRAELIDRVDRQGWSVSAAARSFGLSSRRAREWVRRGRAHEPLTDRSSRPQRTHAIAESTRVRIVDLRRERLTLAKIAELTGVSLSSVARVCRVHGLNRLKLIDAAAPPPALRYERERAGDLLHLDIKKLGRFREVGHRITGTRTFGKGGGWERLHVAIDDHSRVIYCEMRDGDDAHASTEFFERAVEWFAAHGVTVREVMTDNGSPYLSHRFRDACRHRGIRHLRTRPYTPRTNGKAERVIQTLLREWAYRFTYQNSDQRRRLLAPYVHFYNVHRKHSSLKYNAPISRLERNNVLTIDS